MEILKSIANEARGICLDMVYKANSGHLGLPLGCSDCAAVLFGQFLNYLPQNPRWINRDRFVLSAGHGSALLYTYLHLSGYDITLEDLQQFRQLHSKTPGHPEFGVTPGVEATTGPLGQGIGNAVGIAVSQKKLAHLLNDDTGNIIDNCTVCLCGDGCLQEGVGQESIALAGLWQLDNLILIYDNNHVTLDASANVSQCEDTRKHFEALGWEVFEVDGFDQEKILTTLECCRVSKGKPHLAILNTVIGFGLDVAGTSKAHGQEGLSEIATVKQKLGLDPCKSFFVSENTRHFFEKRKNQLQKKYNAWLKNFEDLCRAHNNKTIFLAQKSEISDTFFESVKTKSKSLATRSAAGEILNELSRAHPLLITCSADLYTSVKNYLKDGGDFSAHTPSGRNLFFGIREHAMGAVMNGIAYDGIFQVSGSTFFAFSDYLKPALRIAALSLLPIWYFFSHDSIAVGEDGPTHQPIEQLAGLRSIPNLLVFRPADYDELIACFKLALRHESGPSVFVLSRQNLNLITDVSQQEKIDGAQHGAYIVQHESKTLETLLIASGSEVELAKKTADLLDEHTRIVSMPCMEVFREQSETYRQQILPVECRKRIAFEAGSRQPWYEFVGLDGKIIGLDTFGASAPENALKSYFHLTPTDCAALIKTI